VRAIETVEPARSVRGATEASPAEEQRTLAMSSEGLDHGNNIVAWQVGRRHGKSAPQRLPERRDNDGTVYYEAIVALSTVMEWGALEGPRAPDGGPAHAAGLINEDHGAALTPGWC
jgi:hypothetical protein